MAAEMKREMSAKMVAKMSAAKYLRRRGGNIWRQSSNGSSAANSKQSKYGN
jgi:hypothetical protein